ncbi:MAG: JAB domain-containing protein [Candidatus Pacebacteria bacterium]|nr:JAB domain-containing protein [Candidatus Paceibacterota bacterium]
MENKYLRKLNIELVDGEYNNPIKGQVSTPKQIYDVFKSLKDKAQETLIAVYLNNDLEVLTYNILSTGSKSETVIDFGDIYGYGFVMKAKYFVLIHNHPKGDSNPSDGDKEIMSKFKDYSKIELTPLDFIIVGDNKYWSMFEEMDGGEYTLGSIK